MSALMRPGYDAVVAAPGFSLGVRCVDGAVAAVDWLPLEPEREATNELAREAARQLRAYLMDPDVHFDLPIVAPGTEFRQRVWRAIAAIPRGTVRTYGDIARELGSSARAVGQACGDNPVPVLVPCHRVVAASGALGGFAHQRAGMMLDVKQWLLTHEGVTL